MNWFAIMLLIIIWVWNAVNVLIHHWLLYGYALRQTTANTTPNVSNTPQSPYIMLNLIYIYIYKYNVVGKMDLHLIQF